MGLMDKFKNLFTDEEIIEEENDEPIEIKEVKKEEPVQQLPTFMREKIEREERNKTIEREPIKKEAEDFVVNETLEIKKELKLQETLDFSEPEEKKEENKSSSFKFPLDLEDNDFVETRSRQSVHKHNTVVPEKKVSISKSKPVKKEVELPKDTKVSALYKDKKKSLEDDKKFRATPIISPIYGVLDKNYSPTDVESNKGENFETRRHSKSVDFDSVRKKAYGSLTEEIKENLMCENCEYLKEAKECKKNKENNSRVCDEKAYFNVEKNNNNYMYENNDYMYENDSYTYEREDYTYEVLEDNSELNYRDITLDEATENYFDYGVEYQKVKAPEEVKIMNYEEEKQPRKEIPPVKSSINLLSTLKKSMGDEVETAKKPEVQKNLELTDDLFNLIDSMYDERNDS